MYGGKNFTRIEVQGDKVIGITHKYRHDDIVVIGTVRKKK